MAKRENPQMQLLRSKKDNNQNTNEKLRKYKTRKATEATVPFLLAERKDRRVTFVSSTSRFRSPRSGACCLRIRVALLAAARDAVRVERNHLVERVPTEVGRMRSEDSDIVAKKYEVEKHWLPR